MSKHAQQSLHRSLKYAVLQKKRGETPLQVLQAWKVVHPEHAAAPLSYAGRLDPMAEGKLLMLIGDECKKQAKYTKLDKEYEVTVLLGASTDTGDLLGLVEDTQRENRAVRKYKPLEEKTITRKETARALERELGSHSRRYPLFSSKTVNGKPLFLYALEGTVKDIQIPEHIETILKISLQKIDKIQLVELQEMITHALKDVPRSDEASKKLGEDFRQDAIRARWTEFFANSTHRINGEGTEFTLLHLSVTCKSGAYMRTLAERIGRSLGVPALAYSINRTKIGTYRKVGPFGFWIKQY
jgi:tRNA U55 pseudouridine synthase TruB